MPTDPDWTYPTLAAAAFVAGVMNAVAGGGTLLTFPTLMAVLAPLGAEAAAVANATSTVALMPGSVSGAVGYRREVAASRRFVLLMVGPSLVGGYIGAWLVGQYPGVFGRLVPWLILSAAVLFLLQQPLNRWVRRHHPDHVPGPAAVAGLVGFQFLVAVYGGYFGAGIGILMLTTLGMMGVADIHRANGVKTVLAAVINIAGTAEFVRVGLVHWESVGVMLPAAVVGGYAGARVARRLPPWAVRWVVVVIGFGLAGNSFLKDWSAHDKPAAGQGVQQ